MYVGPVRRKKINLWLLILIILFIVAIVFTIIHMMNSSNANSDSRYSQKENSSNVVNKEYSGSRIGKVDSYDSFSDIENDSGSTKKVEMYNTIPEETSEPKKKEPLKLNEHTFNYNDIGESSIQGEISNQYIELKKGDLLYKITTEKSTFDDILHKEELKKYIEDTYKLQITSELKTGTVNNVKMIICTIADTNSVGYLIVTPLNDTEVLFLRANNANNPFALIEDLSGPFNDIPTIKTNIQ